MWDDVEEETPAQPEAPAKGDAPAEGGEAAGEKGASAEGGAKPEEAEPPAPETSGSNEARRLVFKHWTRPRFLQYSYLYDYQKSYYDDLINYMDRRNRGMRVEVPSAQTWAERALRTYLANTPVTYTKKTNNQDKVLLRHISMGARFQRYHSKSLITRKYSHLGFNTVYL